MPFVIPGRQANSDYIIAQTEHTGSAAQVCLDYDDGIYSDWFLPSQDELNLMYQNLHQQGVGGFADYYWSSSESAATGAYLQNFNTGGLAQRLKEQHLECACRSGFLNEQVTCPDTNLFGQAGL